MRLFILGLRRSGTTIFWQTFRSNPSLLGLNEPFNPVLADLPLELPNRSRAEVIAIFREDPKRFWRKFAPIPFVEEMQEGLSDRQRAYLAFLLDRSSGTVMDETRVHFKLADLAALAPDAVVVHLYRSPARVATSHLIPTGSGGRRSGALQRLHGRATFWTRRDRFNYWGVQEIVTRSPESLFGQRCREIGLDPARIYALPAVGQLLAWWRICYERVEADGPRLFGERFLRVSYEDFCRQPEDVVRRVYRALGLEVPALDVSRVHPPDPPHASGDLRWQELFDAVQIPGELRG